MRRAGLISLVGLVSLAAAAESPVGARDLFDGFRPGWRGVWREQRLFGKPTVYEVAQADGRPVLHAKSDSANAGLLRPVAAPAGARIRLNWRWKVARSLAANHRERERAGDDYAARVFIVFEKSALPLRTRAINYVWAAHQPPGAVYASPYSSQVGMVVVRSGDAETGVWHAESRDVLADYRRFFGEEPREISAIAVLVDTDNTGLAAEAWFSDLRLEPGATAR